MNIHFVQIFLLNTKLYPFALVKYRTMLIRIMREPGVLLTLAENLTTVILYVGGAQPVFPLMVR